MKTACFGYTLEPEIGNFFVNLKDSFLSLQELCDILGETNMYVPGSFIFSCATVEPFVIGHKYGLGKHAVQCGESIHAKFKPTWSRFARSEGHSEHGENLLSAVKQFGGRIIS